MKAFILNTQTMQWPIYQGDFEVAHPDMDSENPSAPFVWVMMSDAPPYNLLTQELRLVEPKPDEQGIWYIQYEVISVPFDRLIASFSNLVQFRLDQFAQTRGYDNITSLTTYSTSTVTTFQIEGQYGVQVRDQMWETLYQILAEVEAGTRPMPQSFEEIEQQLPQLEWPKT